MIVSTYNNYSNCYVGHGDVVELLQQLLRLRRRLPDVVKYDVVVLMQLMGILGVCKVFATSASFGPTGG